METNELQNSDSVQNEQQDNSSEVDKKEKEINSEIEELANKKKSSENIEKEELVEESATVLDSADDESNSEQGNSSEVEKKGEEINSEINEPVDKEESSEGAEKEEIAEEDVVILNSTTDESDTEKDYNSEEDKEGEEINSEIEEPADKEESPENIEKDEVVEESATVLDSADDESNSEQGNSSGVDKKEEEINEPVDKKESSEGAEKEKDVEETIVVESADDGSNEEVDVKSEVEEKLEVDYTKLSREELVTELAKIIEPNSINDIRKEVEAIKASFYKKQKALNEKKRKEFLADGGNIEDFAPIEDPLEVEVKDLFKKYRSLKAEYNRKLENVKEINLKKKYEIIEELKELINKDESIGDTFKEFRELQIQWKETGQVPQQKLKDLWNTYHHHVEKFYDYVNINKELRDLDLKKNQEIKVGLCEKAEKLIDEQSVVSAFRNLQKLHNQWREIGPVPNEQKDTVWERFKEATRIINKKHQDYFKNLKNEQKDNLAKKEELCEQVEKFTTNELTSHKEWSEQTNAILNLQKTWRTIGFAPKKDNNKIYARFRNTCDKFYAAKREFYAQNKELQDENLRKKVELCERAEALKDSTDWKKTSNDLIALQKEWKEVGPVSRKQSDKVWKRFRAACDYFFGSKTKYYSNIETEYEENLKLKEEIISKVKNYQFSDDVNDNYEAFKTFQEEFSEIGFVPYKQKDKIQNEFREELNKQFDKLKVGDAEKSLFKFQTRLETLQQKPKSYSKIKHERDKFFNKIKKLETDISLWENNIGFFSAGSDEAKEMLSDYQTKIDEARKEIKVMEEKVRMIDRADSE